jgi:hypothetical protein
MVFGLTTLSYISGHAAKRSAEGVSMTHPSNKGGGEKSIEATLLGVLSLVGISLWVLVMIVTVAVDVGMSLIPAYLAYKCNPEHPIVMGLVGFFFSEIYLFVFLMRKFIIKEKGYCPGC